MIVKPTYRVPLMSELAAIEPSGYTLVSTFSGCGGSCLGFRLAGFRVLWASEFVDAAAATYAANYPETPLDRRDIRAVEAADILAATGLRRGDLDVLEGSPPCASFSMAGKRAASWGAVKPYSDTKQRVDDLFFEYARLVDGLRPRVFVAENVSGLVKGVAKGYFLDILRALKAPGYVVAARLLDAQWLGVPQARQRIIFVGVRNDLVERYGVRPAFPKPLPYRYSVRDALPEIAGVEHANGYNGHAYQSSGEPAATVQATRTVAVLTSDGERSLDEPAPTVLQHGRAHGFYPGEDRDLATSPAPTIGATLTTGSPYELVRAVEPESRMDAYSTGRKWDELRPGESVFRGGGRLWRPDPDAPSPTVVQRGGDASAASVAHPTERRKFSIAELRRICGFPDDFVLTGTYAQQWERLGRAVPPPMMYAVARVVRDDILRRCRDDIESA